MTLKPVSPARTYCDAIRIMLRNDDLTADDMQTVHDLLPSALAISHQAAKALAFATALDELLDESVSEDETQPKTHLKETWRQLDPMVHQTPSDTLLIALLPIVTEMLKRDPDDMVHILSKLMLEFAPDAVERYCDEDNTGDD